MKLPNHIILDFNSSKKINNNTYWVFTLLSKRDISKVTHSSIGTNKTTNIFVTEPKLNLLYKNTYTSFLKLIKVDNSFSYLSNTNNLLNINFLRKERLYTKLKYSRSPAYDIVSGGAAAIFAGLLGFLISEKFGMELVDSGDFYYLFMYLVFCSFSIKPLLTVSSGSRSFIDTISLRRIFNFYKTLLTLLLKFFK